MNNTSRKNNLSFYNDQGILTLSAKQYDTGRKFIFNIIDNDEPFDLTGCSVYLRILKADGTQFQGEECCSVSANTITVDTSVSNGDQILACAGLNKCEIHVRDANCKSLTTWTFYLEVIPRVHNGDHIDSIDSWDAWDKMVDEVYNLQIKLSNHMEDKENPHQVTKTQIGLGNVEDKSSDTIRSELTKDNVTTALGYTPYTPNEVDNKLSALETNIDWKESVETYTDIATAYPEPEDGWTVNVKDTDYTYRYNGTTWVAISANAIPKATDNVDGLLSKEDHANYADANSKKHTHDNKSVLDGITSALVSAWNGAVTHISDTVKHIPSGGSSGQVLKRSADGTVVWGNVEASVTGTLPIGNGGTGAGNAAAARSNLGVMGAVSANGYYGMAQPDGNTTQWLRTSSNGIIPFQSGGASDGHSQLGTDSWYFSKAYIQNIYGRLNGTADNADKLGGNAASSYATKSELENLKSNFQDGCNRIATAVTALGINTSSGSSPATIANNIAQLGSTYGYWYGAMKFLRGDGAEGWGALSGVQKIYLLPVGTTLTITISRSSSYKYMSGYAPKSNTLIKHNASFTEINLENYGFKNMTGIIDSFDTSYATAGKIIQTIKTKSPGLLLGNIGYRDSSKNEWSVGYYLIISY